MSEPDLPAPSAAPAALQLLGAPACVSGTDRRPLSANDAALLALLALRGPLPRAWLAQLLWPGRPADTALAALRQRGFRLRQSCGTALLEGSGSMLALGVTATHDLGDPRERLRHDAGAVAEPLLGEMRFERQPDLAAQVEAERERWAARVQDALAEVAAEHDAAGRLEPALACIERLVRTAPLREHAVCQLMRLHHRLGDRAAALLAFERLKQALYDELGEAPADETAALAVDIARGRLAGVARRRSMPLALQHPPRTVGREGVLADAQALLERLGAVLLTGPAGIGKTRVFDELLHRPTGVLVCRLSAGDRATELAALGRLAAAWLAALPVPAGDDGALLAWLAAPHTGPPPGGSADADRLARRLTRLLAAAPAAGIATVAIDDLHFADDASLAMLARHWGQGGPGPRWILTSRDLPLPLPLAAWIEAAGADADPQLVLPALSAQALDELLGLLDSPGLDPVRWAPALHAHCGGHPLAALQVLRALHDAGALGAPAPPPVLPVPAEALRRVTRALDRGDPRAQQLAFVAALAGVDFDAALAARLLRCTATDLLVPWRQLEAMDVLRGAAFAHELMRQSVLEAVPAALAPAIHREIAQALSAKPGAAARRALHWEAAAAWPQAADDHRRAADEALTAGLQAAARERLLHAAALHERAGHEAAAFDARCDAALLTRGTVTAAEALAHARGLVAAAAGRAQRARALCALADALAEEHDDGALAAAEEAAACAAGHAALEAAARLRLARAQRILGRPAQALALVERLLETPCALPPADRREAEVLHGTLLAENGQRRRAVGLLLDRYHAALAAGDESQACELASCAAIELGYLGRIAEGHALLAPNIERARRTGCDETGVLMDEMSLSALAFDLGHFDEVIDRCERAVAGMREGGRVAWRMQAEHLLASAFMLLGRPDLALRPVAETPAEAPTWARALRRATQARLGVAQGILPLAGLQEAAAMLDAGGVVFSAYVRERLALELARWSAPAHAAARAAAIRRWACEQEHASLARMAAWIEVEAASRAGECVRAAALAYALVEEATDVWDIYNVYRAELWCTLCRAWDEGGQPQRAQALARSGAAWLCEVADRHVPALFRGSFLDRNPHNRELLLRAR